MEMQALDFAPSNALAGFRLHRFEVYNWGTFHNKVWHLSPEGENSLLTGDIGSGKSTLVDALTTLLVPPRRLVYNKAAGAEARERSLRSYVLGYYKSERGDSGQSPRSVALRDRNHYSVVLGHFHNAGYDQDVTLAQVFWMKDTAGQPERFLVVADQALTIAGHFAEFGSDINDLRKRLRRHPQVELYDAFPAYGAAFRRRFGLESEQALELFNQTVSMKSVGNLTDFVREHMLEAFPLEERIEALIHHFDDLNRAHEAVLKARRQIEALEPLVADCEQYRKRADQAEQWRECRNALRPWFAGLKDELLVTRLENLRREEQRLLRRLEELEHRRGEQLARRDQLKRAIADNGGDRLEQVKADIRDRQARRDERRRRAEQYAGVAEALGWPDARDADGFDENRRRLPGERDDIGQREAQTQARIDAGGAELHQWRRQHRELTDEIDSLKQRRSSIPAAMLALRQRLCESLSLAEEELPFAGELLAVRDEDRDWEGAAERLLHNFALSLLVPEAHYKAVAEWVDRTHLRGRLVYYRVGRAAGSDLSDTDPDALARKLVIRPDSAFYAWLEVELARRFDHVCCADFTRFRREKRAITRAGQIKTGGTRHEKDDRHRIDDRSRYVLGWSNEAKIEALEQQVGDLERQMQARADEIAGEENRRKALRERLSLLDKLEVFTDFPELDWRPLVAEIEELERELRELENESDILRTLESQLDELEAACRETEAEIENIRGERARNGVKREQAEELRQECATLLEGVPEEWCTRYFPELENLRPQALGEHTLTVESCDNRERDMREWLQARIDAESKRLETLRDRIIRAMQAYCNDWPLDTREVDVSLEAAHEYRSMLEHLRADDLPRFEKRFKELLNENTIREIANFQAHLHREKQIIRERIDTINRSLHEIDYNPGRYITLLAEPAADTEIRDFQQELRACTEGALTGSEDEQYSEQKFLQVRHIIERFRGREGLADLDRRWTRKVTDVRNWFVFSASERWREDDVEYEHYSDSGGKSGGQKEKLAYTVLAASLAYQFGLEWGEQRSRSFRFVVIDEAFGRGSDESARYGLELFRRLDLQLLIVTPLQKIHIIEPFVASVGFVHNEQGSRSMVRNLTIEEYRAEKAARAGVTLES